MKKYKYYRASKVNTDRCKAGWKWRYRGLKNSVEQDLMEVNSWSLEHFGLDGYKFVDAETGEVVAEQFFTKEEA